jgi:hypothetical protein
MTGIRLAALLWAFNSGGMVSAAAYCAGKARFSEAAFFGLAALALALTSILTMSRERKR